MINRTKIFTIALTGALAAVALTGCGGSASSSAAPSSVSTAAAESPASSAAASAVVDNASENGSDALDGVFNALLEADPISNQFEIAAMNIEYDFGLQADDVVSYKGVKSNDNGDAGLVLVLEAADGKAEDVANQLASYQQDQVAFYGNYAEFAQAQDNVENAVIAFKGNTVVMVIAWSVSNTTVTSPSAGAYIFPSEGITANPSPSIFSENVGSGTSVRATAFPLQGDPIQFPFRLPFKKSNM